MEESKLKVKVQAAKIEEKAVDINQEIFNIVNKYIKNDSKKFNLDSFRTPRKK